MPHTIEMRPDPGKDYGFKSQKTKDGSGRLWFGLTDEGACELEKRRKAADKKLGLNSISADEFFKMIFGEN